MLNKICRSVLSLTLQTRLLFICLFLEMLMAFIISFWNRAKLIRKNTKGKKNKKEAVNDSKWDSMLAVWFVALLCIKRHQEVLNKFCRSVLSIHPTQLGSIFFKRTVSFIHYVSICSYKDNCGSLLVSMLIVLFRKPYLFMVAVRKIQVT